MFHNLSMSYTVPYSGVYENSLPIHGDGGSKMGFFIDFISPTRTMKNISIIMFWAVLKVIHWYQPQSQCRSRRYRFGNVVHDTLLFGFIQPMAISITWFMWNQINDSGIELILLYCTVLRANQIEFREHTHTRITARTIIIDIKPHTNSTIIIFDVLFGCVVDILLYIVLPISSSHKTTQHRIIKTKIINHMLDFSTVCLLCKCRGACRQLQIVCHTTNNK